MCVGSQDTDRRIKRNLKLLPCFSILFPLEQIMNSNSANWKYLNTIAILFYKKKDNIHFWYLNT